MIFERWEFIEFLHGCMAISSSELNDPSHRQLQFALPSSQVRDTSLEYDYVQKMMDLGSSSFLYINEIKKRFYIAKIL